MAIASLVSSASALAADGRVNLIQPLGDNDTVEIGEGADTFLNYFNDSVGWIMSVAVGFCVVWVLIAGVQIMISKDATGRKSGKDRAMWAIAGLVMLLFAGFILRTLNSMFFR